MRKHPQLHPVEAVTLEVDSRITAARQAVEKDPRHVIAIDRLEEYLRAQNEVYAQYNGFGEPVQPPGPDNTGC